MENISYMSFSYSFYYRQYIKDGHKHWLVNYHSEVFWGHHLSVWKPYIWIWLWNWKHCVPWIILLPACNNDHNLQIMFHGFLTTQRLLTTTGRTTPPLQAVNKWILLHWTVFYTQCFWIRPGLKHIFYIIYAHEKFWYNQSAVVVTLGPNSQHSFLKEQSNQKWRFCKPAHSSCPLWELMCLFIRLTTPVGYWNARTMERAEHFHSSCVFSWVCLGIPVNVAHAERVGWFLWPVCVQWRWWSSG